MNSLAALCLKKTSLSSFNKAIKNKPISIITPAKEVMWLVLPVCHSFIHSRSRTTEKVISPLHWNLVLLLGILILVAIQSRIRIPPISFPISFTTAKCVILGDLFAFVKQSRANFSDIWQNNWRRQRMNTLRVIDPTGTL